MDLDVDAILQGYLRGARARGAQLLTDTELLALRRDGQRWTATTRNAEIRARVVVNAGGAWADHIAGLAGVQPIGLQPRRRSAFLFAVRGYVVDHWPMVKDVDEAFYFKPDAGRLLGSPADQTPVQPHDARADELALAHGVDRIERATTLSVGSLLHKWAGLRSFVADERPVVGYAPDVEGFFWVAGQGGVGIETAPALSRVAAAIAVHGEVPAGIAQYGVTGADLAATRRSLLAAR